ncbi:MAG: glycogen synthase [Verrucomicrobiales bacterium]
MKICYFTKEFPPAIYGGAGVHIQYLSREMAKLADVETRYFGPATAQGQLIEGGGPGTVRGYGARTLPEGASATPGALASVFEALDVGLQMNQAGLETDLVHVHTWYAHWAGIVAKLNYGLPMVLTVHSLEPLRPWKREQLGGGYDFTCWLEKTAIEMADAVIAVSKGAKADVEKLFDVDPTKLHVVHNGIDLDEYQRIENPSVLAALGIPVDEPFVLFVGRITRQKGIVHLVKAIQSMDPGFHVVLCAGAPDTPEIDQEMKQAVAEAQALRAGIHWIPQMLDNPSKIALYSHASVFICPSIYEPFGIINLEAMACGTPVVASAVGGIPEVVVDEETGLLVEVQQQTEPPYEPEEPGQFAQDLAVAVNRLMKDGDLRARMGEAGRKRVVEHFAWSQVAKNTLTIYERLLSPNATR